MHRFYLPPDKCAGPALELTDREAHHAAQVLRLRPGDSVQVLDGAGQQLMCTVQDSSKARVHLQVVKRDRSPPLPYRITLLQALPKGKLFESIVQKSTELGVFRIVPLLSERVIVHLDPEDVPARTERWRQTAVEAIKQCGSAWLPFVEDPVTPLQFLDRKEKLELSVFGALQPNARHPREYLQDFSRRNQRLPASVAVWIGPEGDFSPAETALLECADVQPITLGPLVLRTETAAVYCLSVFNYELQAPFQLAAEH